MTTFPGQESTTHLLTLIRHPETIANVAHLLQGSTDSPLSVHGQNQQNALIKAIENSGSKNTVFGRIGSSPLLEGHRPTLIWSSPLPRALNLANAIKEAFEAKSDDTEEEVHRHIPLVARITLEEKSFGNRECSREGRHVLGFPIGIKPSESSLEWSTRVKQEGKLLLDTATSMSESKGHLVVVTHGLWISAFFKQYLPPTLRLPFADNTGVFTLKVDKECDHPSKSLRVLCANDVSHLAGLKRQRGGIGSSASDKRQRTLGDMWTKKSKQGMEDT
jgi:broad specificity phosphatase PhoE